MTSLLVSSAIIATLLSGRFGEKMMPLIEIASGDTNLSVGFFGTCGVAGGENCGGFGMSVVFMALIIGVITLAIYVRQRSLPMLAILGTYEIAVFSSIVTSQYVSSQYQIAIYIIGIGLATAVMMMILRMVKE